MTHKDFQLLRRLSYRKDKVKTMISDKTDSSSDKNTKKAKNKVLGHLLSLFFGILLGGLLCLLLVVAARHMGLISFGEADSFYDTAVSYYSEQFGDAASAQRQDPPSFARFYTAMSPSIWSGSFRRMFCWKGKDRRMPILLIPTLRIRKVRPLPLQKRSPERRYVRHQNFRKAAPWTAFPETLRILR